MRRHELLDYCDASEKIHYKWYPKGVLIRGDNNTVCELMGEFHERDYLVDGGRGICYLRYASDPLGLTFMQNVRFSYKQTSQKVYEEASCFQNEQEGEVSGLKRVRDFTMTDMHAACASTEGRRNTVPVRNGRERHQERDRRKRAGTHST